MPPARRSKRVLGEAADQVSSTKRRYKPRTSSLAAFDASRPLQKQSRGRYGNRKQGKPSNPPSPILPSPAPTSKARGTTIEINTSSPQPSSPITSSITATPFTQITKQARKQPLAPPFDLTYMFDKDPHHVSICITPNMEGKRKDKDQILLGLDLNDFNKASFQDL